MSEVLHTHWKSPSNIALIKYWGKTGHQIPCNPSLSITLDQAHTDTRIEAVPKQGDFPEPELYFEGKRNLPFETKILGFFQQISDRLPVVTSHKLLIHSENSFPHSAGIASSASAMSALALGLCELQRQLDGGARDAAFFALASDIARLGSGSASRSVYGGLVSWGKHADLPESSNEVAAPLPFEVHEVFTKLHDDILILDRSPKKVSSRAGHGLMKGNLFSEVRFKQANQHFSELLEALKTGDWDRFIAITESEALSLHAMMLTSTPPYLLIQPQTVKIIKELQDFRQQSGLPVCFTLDAGPNVHLIYPHTCREKVQELLSMWQNDSSFSFEVLPDVMGKGPICLK